MTLDELIDRGKIERVAVDVESASAARHEARKHLDSARKICDSDPHGAYQLAYDAARKAIVAMMREEGLRVRRGEGAHMISGQYARASIDDDLGRRFERMRRARNTSQYGVGHFERAEVDAAIETAEAILAVVTARSS